jgi:hypothetical protein
MDWSAPFTNQTRAKEDARKQLGEEGDRVSEHGQPHNNLCGGTIYYVTGPKGAVRKAAFVVCPVEAGFRWAQIPLLESAVLAAD